MAIAPAAIAPSAVWEPTEWSEKPAGIPRSIRSAEIRGRFVISYGAGYIVMQCIGSIAGAPARFNTATALLISLSDCIPNEIMTGLCVAPIFFKNS